MSTFNKFQIKKKTTNDPTAVIYAAALQDHFIRNKNLNKLLAKPQPFNPNPKPKYSSKF